MRLRAAVVALACLTAAPLPAQDTAGASAAIPGDVIRLAVWRAPEFTGEYPIADDGTILHPLLTGVRVAGVPPAQVRARITEVLRQFESDPRFVFSILHRISVTGEVRLPGLYPLPAETTIPQAVAAAGGATNLALPGRIHLIRDGQTTVIDLRTAAGQAGDMRIRPGDRLEIPRRTSPFRDLIVPMASVVAAIGAVVGVFSN
jgi:polysaccharide biosynthesis/export protein